MIHFTVSDIRQYIDCPRVVFFTYTLAVEKKTASKTNNGHPAQNLVQNLARNILLEPSRKLKKHHLDEGELVFDSTLTSSKLGLSGQPDLIVKGKEGLFPVEFNNTTQKLPKGHIYQLAAYALLLEDHYGILVNKGFVYLIPIHDIEVFHLTKDTKDRTLELLALMREMIRKEQMPEQAKNQCSKNQCTDCGYQNFCGDVW